jgi:hypothetical protein
MQRRARCHRMDEWAHFVVVQLSGLVSMERPAPFRR